MAHNSFFDISNEICHRVIFGPRYVTLDGDPAHVKWYQGFHESASFKVAAAVTLGIAGWQASQGYDANVVSTTLLIAAGVTVKSMLIGRFINDWIGASFSFSRPSDCVVDKNPGPLTQAKHLDYATDRKNTAIMLLTLSTLSIRKYISNPISLLIDLPENIHYISCWYRYNQVLKGRWAIVDRPKQEQLERVNGMSGSRASAVRGAKPALGFTS